jgi:hypothetical protein
VHDDTSLVLELPILGFRVFFYNLGRQFPSHLGKDPQNFSVKQIHSVTAAGPGEQGGMKSTAEQKICNKKTIERKKACEGIEPPS